MTKYFARKIGPGRDKVPLSFEGMKRYMKPHDKFAQRKIVKKGYKPRRKHSSCPYGEVKVMPHLRCKK